MGYEVALLSVAEPASQPANQPASQPATQPLIFPHTIKIKISQQQTVGSSPNLKLKLK
jgi:hypothetical protein